MRIGELCALKWADVQDDRIFIHAQLKEQDNEDHGVSYFLCEGTKNERQKLEKTGRYFPIYDELRSLLCEIKESQNNLGIESEWVICNYSGEHLTTNDKALRKICKQLGFAITNNHALRKSFNAYVLCEKIPNLAVRSKMLGHSVSTNMNYYSHISNDDMYSYANALNS